MKCALLALLLSLSSLCAEGATSVWKVTDANKRVLYLGGSWHALRAADYPLPRQFQEAFAKSQRLLFEVDPAALERSGPAMQKAGTYRGGDSLKNHVDPRTYDFLRRLFALRQIPEAKWSRYRPWFMAMALQSASLNDLLPSLGVEAHFVGKARTAGKPISGLETFPDHLAVFSRMSPAESEATLLLTFIPGEGGPSLADVMKAWRRGDADYLANVTLAQFRDFPAVGERVLSARNERWIPSLKRALNGGQTFFVLVGAAHMGGPRGLLALLRAQGAKVEQL